VLHSNNKLKEEKFINAIVFPVLSELDFLFDVPELQLQITPSLCVLENFRINAVLPPPS